MEKMGRAEENLACDSFLALLINSSREFWWNSVCAEIRVVVRVFSSMIFFRGMPGKQEINVSAY